MEFGTGSAQLFYLTKHILIYTMKSRGLRSYTYIQKITRSIYKIPVKSQAGYSPLHHRVFTEAHT